uniref:IP15667p n=1 Tax=Drosophila melanogaster TaxID=7227 RepID=C3KGQ6_DROME|nr:IP15667p [Drosophila melanogaster]
MILAHVSAVVDEIAILRCRVKNKGNRTVSWMRKRDLHILTTNIYTYTGDQRFSVIHPPGSEDWDLKIDYAQPRDSGVYECQLTTTFKTLKLRSGFTTQSRLEQKFLDLRKFM